MADRDSALRLDLGNKPGLSADADQRGVVYLVGAGPGNPELLTLRALYLMQKADVVLYDRLVGPEILALVRSDAQQFDVGKARDNHAYTQARINQLLVEHARAGKRVLRLKGGDPLVFGRGGEEIEALIAAGIPFQIVPGITAATGCAAYAGIPLTHRGMAHACVFLTGHFADGEDHVDWKALVRPGQTLVFYMGVYHLEKICGRLLEHGMSAQTPAAVVQEGTLPGQRVVAAPLGLLARSAIDRAKPGIVIIGETVKLSPYFRAPGQLDAQQAERPASPPAEAAPVEDLASASAHFCSGEAREGHWEACADQRLRG